MPPNFSFKDVSTIQDNLQYLYQQTKKEPFDIEWNFTVNAIIQDLIIHDTVNYDTKFLIAGRKMPSDWVYNINLYSAKTKYIKTPEVLISFQYTDLKDNYDYLYHHPVQAGRNKIYNLKTSSLQDICEWIIHPFELQNSYFYLITPHVRFSQILDTELDKVRPDVQRNSVLHKLFKDENWVAILDEMEKAGVPRSDIINLKIKHGLPIDNYSQEDILSSM